MREIIKASDFWNSENWQDRFFIYDDIRCLLYERVVDKDHNTVRIDGYDPFTKTKSIEWTSKESFEKEFKGKTFMNALYYKVTWLNYGFSFNN